MTTGVKLDGIFPPLPTPFTSRGDLDLEGLRKDLAKYNATGLAGYVALGSNGEAVHLSTEERVRVIDAIRRQAGDRTVVAGVNELTTSAAIEACRRAAEVGAHTVLVITPYFYKGAMNHDVLYRHFNDVADRSPLPVLVYNVPQNTGVIIEPATIAALARHENIIGVKDSSGNMGALSETIRLTPDAFSVLTGNGGILYPSLAMGAKGAVLALACVAPQGCVELFDAVRKGEHDNAQRLQHRLAPLSQIITAGLGVAGLKAALEIAGFTGGAPRAPLRQVSETDRERIRSVMRDTGFFPGLE